MAKRGDRVELVWTSDPATVLRSGDRGTVTRTTVDPFDRSDTIWVDWDSGSRLALIAGTGDAWKVVETA